MTLSKHIRDREKDKFTNDGHVKVSIEADNAGIGGGGAASSVTVNNAVGSPVPVSIINPDANNDLEVTVKNAFQYVYDMVYDGSQWRFQLSDDEGKAINLDRTYYTTADITALGSSTNINDWLGAFNDQMLQKIFVHTYDQEHELITFYTHPSLGDGNKCLKITRSYSTENSVRVVKTLVAGVVDWAYDDDLEGSISLTLGSITSPNPSSAIAVGTDICTIAVACTTGGSVTIALSGTNASLYTLRNVTDGTTGASLAYDVAKSYVLETAVDYGGSSSYSHSVTITATEDAFSKVATGNVATSGTYVVSSYTNLKNMEGPTSHVIGGAYREQSNGGLLSTTANIQDYSSNPITVNFWLNKPSSWTGEVAYFGDFNSSTGGLSLFGSSTAGDLILYPNTGSSYAYRGINLPSGFEDDWIMVTIVLNTTLTTCKFYLQNDATFSNTEHTHTIASGSISDYASVTGNPIANTGFLGARGYANYIYPSYASAMTSNTIMIDEFTAWNKILSVTEIEELHNSFVPYDPTTHSASSDLFRYIRFGDGDDDTESVLKCEIDSGFVLDKDSGASATTFINSLGASEEPYVS